MKIGLPYIVFSASIFLSPTPIMNFEQILPSSGVTQNLQFIRIAEPDAKSRNFGCTSQPIHLPFGVPVHVRF